MRHRERERERGGVIEKGRETQRERTEENKSDSYEVQADGDDRGDSDQILIPVKPLYFSRSQSLYTQT